jgi:hypothetical protein
MNARRFSCGRFFFGASGEPVSNPELNEFASGSIVVPHYGAA